MDTNWKRRNYIIYKISDTIDVDFEGSKAPEILSFADSRAYEDFSLKVHMKVLEEIPEEGKCHCGIFCTPEYVKENS
jgi:hypothetical protein